MTDEFVPLPPRAGEVRPKAGEGDGAHTSPLRLARLCSRDTSPVNGGGGMEAD